MTRTFTLPLAEVIRETPDAVTLVMNQPAVDRVSYYAGQYLTFRLDLKGEVHYRSYSLSSTPRLDRHLAVTVRSVPGGLVSPHLVQHARPGDLMTFLRPAGRFYIETATKSKRHLVLWAAGSGITPLMSMLRAILFLEPLSRVSLIYQNHHIDRIIFREQLQALYQKFRRRFGLWHYISQPAPGSPLIHRPGRISPEAVQGMLRVLPSMPPPSHYLCGPEGFRRTVRRGLEMGGIGGERIFEEAFVADATVLASQASLEGPMRAVRVTLGTETYQVKVPPGSTLLEAALQQGIDLPYSCKQGTCSTCMGQCLSGQVQMDRPEALLDFEMAQGKVLTCQTRPLSDDVHIRIGF